MVLGGLVWRARHQHSAALVKQLAEPLENFPQIVRVIFDDPQTFL
jgi:hypothetical protein